MRAKRCAPKRISKNKKTKMYSYIWAIYFCFSLSISFSPLVRCISLSSSFSRAFGRKKEVIKITELDDVVSDAKQYYRIGQRKKKRL
jgi:hypothetical protein